MGTYHKRLVQHLSRYRRERLGVPQCGTFRHKGVERPYGHILPRELRWLNVPEPFRAEVHSHVVEHRIQLHKYFHHLNSSQAFALSLFYPYLVHAAPVLSNALGVEPIAEWAFEEVPDPGEGTNVDVVLRSGTGAPIYCEVKLSETEFGTARPDEHHCRKVEKIYRPRLAGKVDPALLNPAAFCASYQILRNLWHAANNPKAGVLFVLPRENEALRSELARLLPMVGAELRSRTRVAYIEDVLDVLAGPTPASDEFRWYGALLRAKYLLKAAA